MWSRFASDRDRCGAIGLVGTLCIAAMLVLATAVLTAWSYIREERRERIEDARAAIESLGGGLGVTNRRGEHYVLLFGTCVNDESLRDLEPNLRAVPDLVEVNLCGTDVSDAGLKYLSHLSSLQALLLSDTKVTQRGVQDLQKQLPNCKIGYGKLSRESCASPSRVDDQSDGGAVREDY